MWTAGRHTTGPHFSREVGVTVPQQRVGVGGATKEGGRSGKWGERTKKRGQGSRHFGLGDPGVRLADLRQNTDTTDDRGEGFRRTTPKGSPPVEGGTSTPPESHGPSRTCGRKRKRPRGVGRHSVPHRPRLLLTCPRSPSSTHRKEPVSQETDPTTLFPDVRPPKVSSPTKKCQDLRPSILFYIRPNQKKAPGRGTERLRQKRAVGAYTDTGLEEKDTSMVSATQSRVRLVEENFQDRGLFMSA